MIYHGEAVSTTPGVAVPLTVARQQASFVTIQPRVVAGVPNTGEVRIGGKPTNAVNASLNAGGSQPGIPSGSGLRLRAGDSGVIWPMMAASPVDLETIYFDVDNSGDGVQFIFGRP